MKTKSTNPFEKINSYGLFSLLLFILLLFGFRTIYRMHNRLKSQSETISALLKQPRIVERTTKYDVADPNFLNENQEVKPLIDVHVQRRINHKEHQINKAKNREKPVKKHVFVLKTDLNIADSISLVKIRGIGPVYAKRIIKYRDLLGGYIHINQLREIYGMTEENFQRIEPQIIVDFKEGINKINKDSIDFKKILRHPYTSYETTKILYPFLQNVTFSKKDYLNLQGIDSLILIKLMPYIDFQE